MLVVLYIMTPLDVILTWLPILGRARVSLRGSRRSGCRSEPEPRSRRPRLAAPLARPRRRSSRRSRLTDRDRTPTIARSFVLGPIDLTLRPGEIVFLAGGNGSGKTTLVKLLAGLYTPEAGTIRVDGRAGHARDAEAYRQLFSVVFADGYLFPTSWASTARASTTRPARASSGSGSTAWSGSQAGRFSTTDLSQGQRKRLALLTAWLEDRPDRHPRRMGGQPGHGISRGLLPRAAPRVAARGKTLLVITHDEDIARRRPGHPARMGPLLDRTRTRLPRETWMRGTG